MNGTWLGAAANVIVASDARNGTPIATTSFTVRRTNQSSVTTVRGARASSSYNRTCTDCIMQRHVFYMDIHGTLRERLFNNETRKWENGTLAQLNIRPTSQPALQVCNGNDFVGNGTSSYRDGLSVFYGSSNNTIQQVGWTYGDTNWVKEQTFVDVNGHGGVACAINSWMSYVVMQNGTNVQFWWRDSNFTKRGNSTHPVGVWQKGSFSMHFTALVHAHVSSSSKRLHCGNISGYLPQHARLWPSPGPQPLYHRPTKRPHHSRLQHY